MESEQRSKGARLLRLNWQGFMALLGTLTSGKNLGIECHSGLSKRRRVYRPDPRESLSGSWHDLRKQWEKVWEKLGSEQSVDLNAFNEYLPRYLDFILMFINC